MSLDPHVTLVFFKQCNCSRETVEFGGHISQENSKPLVTILVFFSQTQLNPKFATKKIILIIINVSKNNYYLRSIDDF